MELKAKIIEGRLSMTAKGFGFVIPDERETDEDTDVFVPPVYRFSYAW